jgi:hypothetical protein
MINIKIKLFLLAATLLFFLWLRFQGAGLVRPYADKGIVSLEIAPSRAETATVLDGWQQDGLITKARNNILIDFFFIPFYSMLFYTLAGSISVRLKGNASKMGVLSAFISLIAGVLDVLENVFMLSASYGHYNGFTVVFTAIFASLKFVLLFLALLYIIIFGSLIVMRKSTTALT